MPKLHFILHVFAAVERSLNFVAETSLVDKNLMNTNSVLNQQPPSDFTDTERLNWLLDYADMRLFWLDGDKVIHANRKAIDDEMKKTNKN